MFANVVIRSLVHTTRSGLDEAALLTTAARGDETAFSELVRLHGPMVMGVCRRVLGPTADADDAFQIAFLALVEHARKLRAPAALPGWLHRTALRAAVKLKARRTAPADPSEPAVNPEPLADLSWKEVRAMLDEELNALPERLRAPLVLCYLDGRTRDAAAAALGVSLSTLKRRVADGLDRLNRRLASRGVVGVGLAAAVLSVTGGPGLTAPVPIALAQRVAVAFGVRPAGTVGISSLIAGWKTVVSAVVLVGGFAAAGAALVASGDPVKSPPPKEEKAEKPDTPKARTDVFGDPLPDGTVLRLGSARFRHTGVREFALLPDGKSVVTFGSDRQIRTWDLATGRETRTVPESASAQGLNSISPDGRYAAGFVGKNLSVFDTETGKEKASFPAPGKNFHSTFFSPDGGTLAVLTWEPRLTLVEWQTNKQREFTLPARKIGPDSTFHGYFSKTGKWVVTGGGSGEAVCVFDVATGAEKHRLDCSAGRSTVTPDDKTLVASVWKSNGQKGSELVKYDLATGRETARLDLGSRAHYYSLDVSPDGKSLACGFSDESCLVDLDSGRILHELSNRPIALAFTRDGKHVVGSTSQKLRVWTATDGKELLDRPGNLGNLPVLATSPDGRWLASADWLDKGVSVWDLTDGRLVRALPFRGEDGRYVRELGFSPDSRTLWAGNHQGFVQWWDVATGKEARSVQLDPPVTNVPKLNYLFRLRVTSDGKTAAALARRWGEPAETTGFVVWDIASGKVKGERSLPAEQRAWAWTVDGSVVALSTPDGLLVADGTNPSRTRFTVPGVTTNAPIAFSPDGHLLAAGKGTDKGPSEVLIVEVATGDVAMVVKTGAVDHLALTAGGRTLVATGAGSLKMFDVATGAERGHRRLPTSANGLLIPDEMRAITALADGTGLVWDLTPFVVPPKLSAATPAKLWEALADKNTEAAHKAGWELVDRSTEAVALLRDKLKPARSADEVTVNALVTKLNDPVFAEREAATKALQALGSAAAPALRSALKGNPSAEQADRIKRLLAAVNAPVAPAGKHLGELRAVVVLERIGTADARKLLEEMATGVPDARLTVEAAAAVARLKGRSK